MMPGTPVSTLRARLDRSRIAQRGQVPEKRVITEYLDGEILVTSLSVRIGVPAPKDLL